MRLHSRDELIAKLHSKQFRDAFVSSRVSNTLALQIRVMRQEREWSQAQLAELLGTSQNAVWRLESPQYGRHSITTLKRLASIFDVGLAVWFVPFSDLMKRFTNLSTEAILVPSFDNDPGLHAREMASANAQATFTVSTILPLTGLFQGMTNIYGSSEPTMGQPVVSAGTQIVSMDTQTVLTNDAIGQISPPSRSDTGSLKTQARQNRSVVFMPPTKTA
jgi:transcriptional regulator with XRE-family HTH domain